MSTSSFRHLLGGGCRRLFVAALLAALARPATAADVGIESVRIGFRQQLKVGSWTPASVTLRGQLPAEGAVVVVAPDFEGNLVEMPLVAAPGSSTFEGLILTGRLDGEIRVEVRGESGKLASAILSRRAEAPLQLQTYRHDTEFWAVLAPDEGFQKATEQLAEQARGAQGSGAPSPAAAMRLDWTDLPADIDGWDALDAVVLSGDALAVSEEQSRQLRRWTARGGRLLLLLGSSTDKFLSSPLAAWTPVAIDGTRTASQFESANALIPGSSKLRLLPGVKGVTAARLVSPGSGDLAGPPLTRGAVDLGVVTVFAFDLDGPPFATWQYLPELCRFLVAPERAMRGRRVDESELNASGVTDLSSQLLSSLDQFGNLGRPTFGSILAWTFVWMLVLGPLDYLLVRRILKRPQWTWATLPLWIVLATVAGARAASTAKSAPLMVNQIDLVDVDPAGRDVRSHSWMTLYSNQTARYDVSAKSSLYDDAARLRWVAKPEGGLRGLYRQGGLSVGSTDYDLSASRTQIDGLPLRTGSTYSLGGLWTHSWTEAETPLFEAELRDAEAGRLRGTLTHHFQGTLTDWIIAYKNFIYYPVAPRGSLAPLVWQSGQSWRPEDGSQTVAQMLLTGRRTTAANLDSVKNQTLTIEMDEFDPLDRNVPRMMRTLLFHEATGGSAYTGLTNHPLQKLDATRLISRDQAVLVARYAEPVTIYSVNGEPQKPTEHWTFIRAVLPVAAADPSRREKTILRPN